MRWMYSTQQQQLHDTPHIAHRCQTPPSSPVELQRKQQPAWPQRLKHAFEPTRAERHPQRPVQHGPHFSRDSIWVGRLEAHNAGRRGGGPAREVRGGKNKYNGTHTCSTWPWQSMMLR